jgi:uncharacterized protein (DUF934 family)
MPLLKDNAFITDSWASLANEAALPAEGRIIVSFDRLTKEWDTLAKFPGVLGALIPNTLRIEQLAPYIAQLSLIVVSFPAFNDGRSYSLARQLRLDGYRGELRATGNILPDQFQFMHQVGIDSYDVSDRFPLEMWEKASHQMSLAYQRGLYRKANEREVWSERHQGFAPWEEQPHAG